ncbi:MAG TPA: Lrp/AsnC family transcriptional regulator [Trueperaceae bacterium]|nr:Lrp/AsnC family transcriptional regulator [Trueperaceae bacterium]
MLESSNKQALDAKDIAILEIIQENATISNKELAELLKMSPSATHSRVQNLKERGYIEKTLTVLNRELLGFDMLCLIHISLQTHNIKQIEEFYSKIVGLNQVLECYHVSGQFDYVLKVAMRNRRELRTFVLEQLTPISYIATVQTSLIFEELKFTTSLPLKQ